MPGGNPPLCGPAPPGPTLYCCCRCFFTRYAARILASGAGNHLHKSVILQVHIGADSGFDGIRETQGACRGAVGLVKSRKKIVANDENYALAA